MRSKRCPECVLVLGAVIWFAALLGFILWFSHWFPVWMDA